MYVCMYVCVCACVRACAWQTLILQGVGTHINKGENAEKLRSKFVYHKGKKTLTVRRDNFVLGEAVNDWAGVVAEFNQQIQANVKPGAGAAMETGFSSSTDDEKTCGGVCVMSAMQKYFHYMMFTTCGFPSITLEGTLADWQLLRQKAEDLVRGYCLPEPNPDPNPNPNPNPNQVLPAGARRALAAGHAPRARPVDTEHRPPSLSQISLSPSVSPLTPTLILTFISILTLTPTLALTLTFILALYAGSCVSTRTPRMWTSSFGSACASAAGQILRGSCHQGAGPFAG